MPAAPGRSSGLEDTPRHDPGLGGRHSKQEAARATGRLGSGCGIGALGERPPVDKARAPQFTQIPGLAGSVSSHHFLRSNCLLIKHASHL